MAAVRNERGKFEHEFLNIVFNFHFFLISENRNHDDKQVIP